MFVGFKRILKAGVEKFQRETVSSGAAVFVIALSIIIATSLFFFQGIGEFLLERLQESVDVSVYFVEGASEQDMLELRDELAALPEVKEVAYVSKEQALESFKARFQRDKVILESLETLGNNPLLSSLNIKVHDFAGYPVIAEFLKGKSEDLIEKVDYKERAAVIAKLENLTVNIRLAMLIGIVALGFVAGLVALNTIRLAISNSKEEIEVMRLVGASNWFIRGPFVVQGAIQGIVGALFVLVLTLFVILLFQQELSRFLSGFAILQYFLSHLGALVALQLGVGLGIGVLSSVIALQKYLKV